MNNTKLAKHFWLWLFLALAVYFATITLWKRWYDIFPTKQVSEVYAKYESVDGISAAFMKEYRINDTMRIDVTVLKADNDSMWTVLLQDFNKEALVKEMPMDNDVWVWQAPKADHSLPRDSVPTNNDVLSLILSQKIICVFETKTVPEMMAVSFGQHDSSIKHN